MAGVNSSSEEEPVAWLRNEIEQDRVFAAACLARPMFGSDLEAIAERVARCEAELAILDEHRGDPSEWGGRRPDGAWQRQGLVCMSCGHDDGHSGVAWPCRTVRLLAGGYKHRPGYREEDWQ